MDHRQRGFVRRKHLGQLPCRAIKGAGRLVDAKRRDCRVVRIQQKQRTRIQLGNLAQVVDALRGEVQWCACVPEHLNRSGHVAVAINQALTLEQRVPVVLRLVRADDEDLGADAV